MFQMKGETKGGRAAIMAAVAVLMLAAVCFVGVGAGSEDVSGVTPVDVTAEVTALPEGGNIAVPTADVAYLVDASTAAVSVNIAGDASNTIDKTISLYVFGSNNVTITYDSETNQAKVAVYAASGTIDALQYYENLVVNLTGDASGTATINNTTDDNNASIKVATTLAVTATSGIEYETSSDATYYAKGSVIAPTLNTVGQNYSVTDGTVTATASYGTEQSVTVEIKGTFSTAAEVEYDETNGLAVTMGIATEGTVTVTSGVLNDSSAITGIKCAASVTGTTYEYYAAAPATVTLESGETYAATSGTTVVSVGDNKVTVTGIAVGTDAGNDGGVSLTSDGTDITISSVEIASGTVAVTGGTAKGVETLATVVDFGYAEIDSGAVYHADALAGTSGVYNADGKTIIVKKVASELSIADADTGAANAITVSANFASAEGLKITESSGFTLAGSYDAGSITATAGTISAIGDSTTPMVLNGTAIMDVDGVTVTAAYIDALGSSRLYLPAGSYDNINIALNAQVYIDNVLQAPTGKTASDVTELIQALEDNYKNIVISGNITIKSSDLATAGLDAFVIPAGTQLDIGAHTLTIGESATDVVQANIVNAKILSDGGVIVVNGSSTFDINNSDVYAVVEGSGYISVSQPKTENLGGQSSGSRDVGYGNTMVMSGYTVSSYNEINVYGTLQINGVVTVEHGADINVYKTGAIQLTSTMNVAGNVNVDGKMTVANGGTVNVSGSSGKNANFNVTGTYVAGDEESYGVVIQSGATFNLQRGNTSTDPAVAYDNTLTVSGTTGKEFVVEGTAVINGTLVGAIDDMGSVTFAGTAGEGATITIYDGVSITVTSVTGGALTIDDTGAATAVAGSDVDAAYISEGNKVVLNNVKNVTVSVEVVDQLNEAGTARYYWSDMTVSGAVTTDATAAGPSVVIDATAAVRGEGDSARSAKISVGDMSLAKYVTLTFEGGDVYVTGTLTSVNENSGITVKTEVTVDGTITMRKSNLVVSGGVLNATYYQTQTEDLETVYNYATFDAAIQNIASTVDDKVVVKGEQTAEADATVPAAHTLEVEGGATFYVDTGVTVTVANGGYMTNTESTTVNGKMVFENWSTAGTNKEPVADVKVVADPARTYLSLTQAIADQMTSITLNKDVTIEEDMTIPAGTTVSSDRYNVIVDDKVTLTVAGSLELPRSMVMLTDAADEKDDAELVVTGNVIVSGEAAGTYNGITYLTLADVAGAHFTKKVNGLTASIISSVEYAAANVDKTVTAITITGSVSAGDVTFTVPENSTLTITVDSGDDTAFTFGTMTLAGAKLVANGSTSGTVTAAAAGSNASVTLSRAVGVTFESAQSETVTGTVDYLYISGAIVKGAVDVTAGTVTVAENGLGVLNGTTDFTGTLTVASGATLSVPNGAELHVYGADADSTAVTVDGTISVDEGSVNVSGIMVINGTMDVSDSGNNGVTVNGAQSDVGGITGYDTVTGTLIVTGTLNVDETDGEEGKVTVSNGVLVIGQKPETLGVGGAVSGKIDFGASNSGYVKVYAGADMANAKIDWNDGTDSSDAYSTAYHINDTLYMTVYTDSTSLKVFDVIYDESFELRGLVNGLYYSDGNESNPGLYANKAWFYEATMADNRVVSTTATVSQYENVYAEADLAPIYGTVSEGNGLKMYIDNVPILSISDYTQYPLLVGTHTVSFDVEAGYNGDNVTITFNGQTIENGGTITITADMDSFSLVVSGAVPASSVSGGSGAEVGGGGSGDGDGEGVHVGGDLEGGTALDGLSVEGDGDVVAVVSGLDVEGHGVCSDGQYVLSSLTVKSGHSVDEQGEPDSLGDGSFDFRGIELGVDRVVLSDGDGSLDHLLAVRIGEELKRAGCGGCGESGDPDVSGVHDFGNISRGDASVDVDGHVGGAVDVGGGGLDSAGSVDPLDLGCGQIGTVVGEDVVVVGHVVVDGDGSGDGSLGRDVHDSGDVEDVLDLDSLVRLGLLDVDGSVDVHDSVDGDGSVVSDGDGSVHDDSCGVGVVAGYGFDLECPGSAGLVVSDDKGRVLGDGQDVVSAGGDSSGSEGSVCVDGSDGDGTGGDGDGSLEPSVDQQVADGDLGGVVGVGLDGDAGNALESDDGLGLGSLGAGHGGDVSGEGDDVLGTGCAHDELGSVQGQLADGDGGVVVISGHGGDGDCQGVHLVGLGEGDVLGSDLSDDADGSVVEVLVGVGGGVGDAGHVVDGPVGGLGVVSSGHVGVDGGLGSLVGGDHGGSGDDDLSGLLAVGSVDVGVGGDGGVDHVERSGDGQGDVGVDDDVGSVGLDGDSGGDLGVHADDDGLGGELDDVSLPGVGEGVGQGGEGVLVSVDADDVGEDVLHVDVVGVVLGDEGSLDVDDVSGHIGSVGGREGDIGRDLERSLDDDDGVGGDGRGGAGLGGSVDVDGVLVGLGDVSESGVEGCVVDRVGHGLRGGDGVHRGAELLAVVDDGVGALDDDDGSGDDGVLRADGDGGSLGSGGDGGVDGDLSAGQDQGDVLSDGGRGVDGDVALLVRVVGVGGGRCLGECDGVELDLASGSVGGESSGDGHGRGPVPDTLLGHGGHDGCDADALDVLHDDIVPVDALDIGPVEVSEDTQVGDRECSGSGDGGDGDALVLEEVHGGATGGGDSVERHGAVVLQGAGHGTVHGQGSVVDDSSGGGSVEGSGCGDDQVVGRAVAGVGGDG